MIDREGAEAITMRALAERLGVTPMALYNHVDGKRDLLRAVADHVIAGAAFDGGHADWRDQIRHCFHTLRNLCLRHPGLPALLKLDGVAPASVFAPMHVALAALGKAGLDEADGLRTYFLLVGFTLSQADYQARGPIRTLEPPRMRRGSATGGAAPWWDFDKAFAFGLALILNGIAATVTLRRGGRP